MSQNFQPLRGFRDLMGEDVARLAQVESVAIKVLQGYGYNEIRLPLLEVTSLFDRSIGESTDTVSKEMYTFELRDGSQVSLRPEATASCVRALLDSGAIRGSRPKWWYAGPMFRHEKPQRGRFRQFYQVGAEAFGYGDPDIDVEMICITADLLNALGVLESAQLEVNTLGSPPSRQAYRKALVQYLEPVRSRLDADSQHRLHVNPLRILDSKTESTQELLQDGPDLHDYLDPDSRSRFDELLDRLEESGVRFTVRRDLVRGLDYYTHTVFEWTSHELGSQKQIGGGGRYDGLATLLGSSQDIPAVGFSMGLDRIGLLLSQKGGVTNSDGLDIYVVELGDSNRSYATGIARSLRETGRFRVREHQGGGKIKNRMREADRSGARWALIIGDAERDAQTVGLKWLREERPQDTVPASGLLEYMSSALERVP